MHYLIQKLLQKKGIENTSELTPEEQIDFDKWQRILSEGEITPQKIADFCTNEIRIIETKWKDLNNTPEKNDKLIIMHTIYKQIINVINGPKAERESLERYLKSQIE